MEVKGLGVSRRTKSFSGHTYTQPARMGMTGVSTKEVGRNYWVSKCSQVEINVLVTGENVTKKLCGDGTGQ